MEKFNGISIETIIKDFLKSNAILLDDTGLESNTSINNLFESGLDSMGIMRLVVFIENNFEITIPEHEVSYDNFVSVDAICMLICKHLK